MKTLLRDKADALFDKYWDDMREEWFKLEVLQDYTGEDDGPSLRNWLEGDKKKSLELITDEDPKFTADCRLKIAQGVRLTRVHIVEMPLSPYMEWEVEYYKRLSIPLRGEQVYLVNAKDLGSLRIPNGDLMLFDSRRAIVNEYDQKVRMVASKFYDIDDNLSSFLELKKTLESHAKKLETGEVNRP